MAIACQSMRPLSSHHLVCYVFVVASSRRANFARWSATAFSIFYKIAEFLCIFSFHSNINLFICQVFFLFWTFELINDKSFVGFAGVCHSLLAPDNWQIFISLPLSSEYPRQTFVFRQTRTNLHQIEMHGSLLFVFAVRFVISRASISVGPTFND